MSHITSLAGKKEHDTRARENGGENSTTIRDKREKRSVPSPRTPGISGGLTEQKPKSKGSGSFGGG
jgi:hypothetical protein